MDRTRLHQMEVLAEKLNAPGIDPVLLSTALTHPSYAMEHPGQGHYQRLEFLGDAVVDLLMGEHLFKMYPDRDEGDLTKMRAGLVCEASLAEAARAFGLGEWMRFGKGEIADGGDQRASNLSDAFEAVCGALFIERGLDGARTFLITHLQEALQRIQMGYYGDFKTRLQEYIQKTPGRSVTYAVRAEEGPAHDRRFHVEVLIDGQPGARGWGKSKKEAQRQAALAYLKKIGVVQGE